MFDVKYSKEEIAKTFAIDDKKLALFIQDNSHTHCVGRKFTMCDDY